MVCMAMLKMVTLCYATTWLCIICSSFTDGLHPSFFIWCPFGTGSFLRTIIIFWDMPWKGIV